MDLSEAVRLSELGYSLFPCIPQGKSPATANGCLAATTDAEQIETWFSETDNNIGLSTNGLCVIDVDPIGTTWLDELPEDRRSFLMSCPLARTPRRGWHIYFRQRPGQELRCTNSRIAAGVDTRADGGYVVAPPSRVASGGTSGKYIWVNELEVGPEDLPEIPDWIASRCGKPATVPAEILDVELDIRAEPPSVKFERLMSQDLFRATWERRRDFQDNSQSSYDLSLATIAKLNGWTDQEVADLVISHRRLHGENVAKALREDYACSTICRASEAAKKPNGVDVSGIVDPGDRLWVQPYSEMEPEEIKWLWEQRLALGKMSIIAGVPGIGKTFLMCDIMARCSVGADFPDGTPSPGCECLMVTGEDGPRDTILPRLISAGADTRRVHHLHYPVIDKKPSAFSLIGQSWEMLLKYLDGRPDVKLIVLDPLASFLPGVDGHKNLEVRAVLTPIMQEMGDRGISVLSVSHLSKAANRAVNRVNGSIAFVAASRAVWQVEQDEVGSDRKLFLNVKNNLGHAGGLAYKISIDLHKLIWEEDAVNLVADDVGGDKAVRPRDEAAGWLRDVLRAGEVSSKVIFQIADEEGHARRTVERAKKEIGVESFRKGPYNYWRLPVETDVSGLIENSKKRVESFDQWNQGEL